MRTTGAASTTTKKKKNKQKTKHTFLKIVGDSIIPANIQIVSMNSHQKCVLKIRMRNSECDEDTVNPPINALNKGVNIFFYLLGGVGGGRL